MAAAARVIVTHGLSAPTAMIAQEAGVANGTLFTYFETKAELFNQLYLELKTETAAVALKGLPEDAGLREQFFHIWSRWMNWAVLNPEKRRAMTQLDVYEEITSASREEGHRTMARFGELLKLGCESGPLRDAPKAFAVAIMSSMADATMDFMIADPENADQHCRTGFETFWRAIA